MLSELLRKIDDRTARVGVVGLGYVGIPLAMRISEMGLPVLGFDVLPERIRQMEAGISPIRHIPDADIAAMRDRGFQATGDYSRAAECDALLICVPTPLDKHREPDLRFVTATMDSLAPYLRAGQLLSLESTTWPGTTAEVLAPYFTRAGLTPGEDAFLVYSPEREDPGNPDFDTSRIPKVVGGDSLASQQAGIALYSAFIDTVVPVSSTRAAELTKLLENIHRAVNIGLVNEMKIIADKMDIDIHEVIRAAATKPFGFTAYYPGPGLGGHCIPIDPFYLTWKARQYGLHTRFIELAGEINSDMPHWVVGKLADALNERGRSVKGSRILVLGIAYKKDVEDMRESPSVELMEILRDKGALVAYSDPHVPRFPPMREHRFDLLSVDLNAESIAAFDVVLLATSHSAFDYRLIQQHASLIIDTRGVYLEPLPNVVKA